MSASGVALGPAPQNPVPKYKIAAFLVISTPILLSLPSPHRLLPHKQCRHFWVLFICLLSDFPCQTRNSRECCLPCLPECPSGEFCTPCSHSVNIEMETQPLTPTFHQQIPTEPTQSQGGFPFSSTFLLVPPSNEPVLSTT